MNVPRKEPENFDAEIAAARFRKRRRRGLGQFESAVVVRSRGGRGGVARRSRFGQKPPHVPNLRDARGEHGHENLVRFSAHARLRQSPILLKTGTLKAELKLDPTAKYAVYPLSLDGARRAPIPAKSANGVLKLDIDTSKLPNGATTLFEIAAVGN